MNKRQEKNDQQVFGDENFFQGSDKFAVRSKIQMNFLRRYGAIQSIILRH